MEKDNKKHRKIVFLGACEEKGIFVKTSFLEK